MYEKYAASLAGIPGNDIHIIGFPPTGILNHHPFIEVHALAAAPFNRISITRILAPLKFLILCFRIKPQVIIITTHELLVPAIICKLIHRCEVLYDVQENYFRNIRYGKTFPPIIRPMLAGWVRMKERVTRPWIALYVLAEKMYAAEMPFMKPRCIVQNKLTRTIRDQYRKEKLSGYHKLVFSGTIAETTGVFQAIDLFRKLHALDNRFSLTIIGHCTLYSTRARLNNELSACTNVIDRSNDHPVPHHEILNVLHNSDFGIICYPDNPATKGSIPSKVYEYMSLALPMLIRHTPVVNNLVRQNHAGFIVDDYPTTEELLHAMQRVSLPVHDLPSEFFWESEFQAVLAYLH